MALETVYQIDYANVSDAHSALAVARTSVPMNAVSQVTLRRRTANHDIHHESRHACAGGACLVELDY